MNSYVLAAASVVMMGRCCARVAGAFVDTIAVPSAGSLTISVAFASSQDIHTSRYIALR